MELIVIPQKIGLTVSFINHSFGVPSNSTFEWDFGDGSEKSADETPPAHTYEKEGFYKVKFKVSYNDGGNTIEEVFIIPVIVTDRVQTTLSSSIYVLINQYLPTGIINSMPFDKKRLFIEKWQLFIHPLINREIPLEFYNNELYYEALENQLIMEAAVLDYLTIELTNLLQSSSTVQSTSDQTTQPSSGIKKIVTGPSEVEYFNPVETDKEIISNVIKAMQPGGFIDTLKKNLCTLSERLDIFLPFCKDQNYVVSPQITNKRRPIKYQGPNPGYPVKSDI